MAELGFAEQVTHYSSGSGHLRSEVKEDQGEHTIVAAAGDERSGEVD